MTIRPATTTDLQSLRQLESKLVELERTFDVGIKPQGEVTYYDLPKLLSDPANNHILIAEDNNQPIGCGLTQIKKNHRCYTNAQYGYIGLMYIEPTHRNQGLGRQIINQLVDWLHSKNITDIHLKVYANNTAAIQAYQQYGFHPHVFQMKLNPTPQGSKKKMPN